MANRVLLGNRSTGGYGLYVSKEGQNVLTCAAKELLFDSRAHRTGLVYAGGNNLQLGDSSSNFLTTGSKPSLGYPPLVIFSEKNTGERDGTDGGTDSGEITDQVSFWKTTTSTVTPVSGGFASTTGGGSNATITGGAPSDGRSINGVSNSRENAINVYYTVLRIPCAYGYMTSTYFG